MSRALIARLRPRAGAAADAPTPADPVARVLRRYRGRGRFARGFVAGKLRRDPVTRAVLALGATAPFGRVADLGCGRGQLGLLLLEAGLARALVGVDWDGRSLADARAAGEGAPASFREADLAQAAVPPCDTALLVDVLYQLPPAAQLPLLRRAAAAASERVIVRAFDPDRGWRSELGFALERALRRARAYRAASISPSPVRDLAAVLDHAGFEVAVEPCWSGTPLPNVLLVATRRRAAP